MESKDCAGCILPPLGDEFISLLGSRGAIGILFIFCCTEQALRFNEINDLMNHISTKTLSTRLKQLERYDILKRIAYNEIPPRVEYSITDKGQELADSLMPLIEWITKNHQ